MRQIASNTLLALGAAAIILSGLFTLSQLTDRVVFTVLVPGFVLGLIFVGIALSLGSKRWHLFR